MSTNDQWVFQKQREITPVMSLTPQPENSVQFFCGGEETLRISNDGFYVNGVRVDADAKEAENVYEAFKKWLAWNSISN